MLTGLLDAWRDKALSSSPYGPPTSAALPWRRYLCEQGHAHLLGQLLAAFLSKDEVLVLWQFGRGVALARLFEGRKAWISSTKSMTGHECWMAGASEIVYSTIMLNNGFVAPNINFENPDEQSAKLKIAAETKQTELKTILSNSFGFGGTNSALVIRKI